MTAFRDAIEDAINRKIDEVSLPYENDLYGPDAADAFFTMPEIQSIKAFIAEVHQTNDGYSHLLSPSVIEWALSLEVT